MSRKISATKKYAAPVHKRCFKKKYASTAFRRIIRAVAMKQQKAKRRKGKRHPSTVKGVPGKPYNLLEHRSTKEQVHATGALKRSERHPDRWKGGRRQGDLVWSYVSR